MKWFKIVKRKRTPLFNLLTVEGIVNKYNKAIDFDYNFKNFVFLNKTWYGEEEDHSKIEKTISKRLDKDKFFLKKFLEKAYEQAEEFDQICKKIQKTDFSKSSNQELKKSFLEYINFILILISYIEILLPLDIVSTKRLNSILKQKVKEKDFQKYFLLFSSPSKIGFFEQENEKLIESLKEIKKDPSLINALKKEKLNEKLSSLFKKHLEEFSWFGNMDYNGKFWNEKDLILRLKAMIDDDIDLRLKEINEIREKREKDIKDAIKKLNLSEDEVLLIDAIREIVYFRTFRTDILFRSGYFVKNLFEEIAKRMNITYQEIFQYFHKEIIDFLDSKEINKKLIEERKKNYAISSIHGEIEILYGDDIKKLESEIEKEEIEEIKEIKGSIASQGKVQGKVKIINTASDLPKVNAGDILVASMTKPDYIIAMEKAIAFITDEGGITCHAAIVAREMGKPCIIGTKIATKVLKDNDLVEVDAEKGIVKIIKS